MGLRLASGCFDVFRRKRPNAVLIATLGSFRTCLANGAALNVTSGVQQCRRMFLGSRIGVGPCAVPPLKGTTYDPPIHNLY